MTKINLECSVCGEYERFVSAQEGEAGLKQIAAQIWRQGWGFYYNAPACQKCADLIAHRLVSGTAKGLVKKTDRLETEYERALFDIVDLIEVDVAEGHT